MQLTANNTNLMRAAGRKPLRRMAHVLVKMVGAVHRPSDPASNAAGQITASFGGGRAALASLRSRSPPRSVDGGRVAARALYGRWRRARRPRAHRRNASGSCAPRYSTKPPCVSRARAVCIGICSRVTRHAAVRAAVCVRVRFMIMSFDVMRRRTGRFLWLCLRCAVSMKKV